MDGLEVWGGTPTWVMGYTMENDMCWFEYDVVLGDCKVWAYVVVDGLWIDEVLGGVGVAWLAWAQLQKMDGIH